MIIEPVPTNSPSRGRRALARAALAVPVLALVAVVGVGLLGRAPEPAPERPAAALATPDAEAAATPVAQGSSRPFATSPPLAVARLRRPPFPVSIDGLRVRQVTDALGGAGGAAPGEVVAVAGYLGIPQPSTDCGDGIDPLGPLCDRVALLTDSRWTLSGSEGFNGFGPHLHARVPIGVRLPEQIRQSTLETRGAPFDAVVVGRFDSPMPDGCAVLGDGCEVGFDLEAVVWSEGSPYRARPFVGPAIDAIPEEWILHNQPAVEGLVVGPDGVALSSALVRPETLTTLDRVAARAARRHPQPGLLWYVRGVRRVDDGQGLSHPEIVWGIVGDVSLELIAYGVVDWQAAP